VIDRIVLPLTEKKHTHVDKGSNSLHNHNMLSTLLSTLNVMS